ncbi:MAG TPA: hypothetical protein VHZ95_18845 [Polyangiales bacterium]|nr:hypothetical protein [Polyangiales bacterium]
MVAIGWLLLACGPSAPRCHFGTEHPIYSSSGENLDDVALALTGEGAIVFFSEPSGAYARALDTLGSPTGPITRIGPQCDAGLSAAVSGSALRPAANSGKPIEFACARRTNSQTDQAGGLSLYVLDEHLRVQHVERFGRVGPNSHGVALARGGDGLTIAWQDADLEGARIWLKHGSTPEIAVSDPAFAASAPGLAFQAKRLFATWAESRDEHGHVESRVRLADASQPSAAQTIALSRDRWPSPDLATSPQGVWLAFRDRRKAAHRTGLYLERLDPAGKPIGLPVRAARADGVGRPVLRPCLGGVLAATPRTFAGDYFVGVVRADADLETLSGEQQFYEDSHEFAQVASTCAGDHALLVMAERARLGRGHAALRSVSFVCD